MIEPFLKSQLEPVARRHRRLRLSRALTFCWLGATLIGFAFLVIERLTGWSSGLTFPTLGIAAAVVSFAIWRRSAHWQPDFRQIARRIEERHPELHALLLTAIEQQPDPVSGQLGYLQERVIREAVLESLKQTWIDTISARQLFAMQVVQIAAFISLLIVLSGLRVTAISRREIARARNIQVTPGDTSVERGNGLAVLAKFTGPLPPEVTLIIRSDSQEERRVPMAKSLDDPIFGATVPEVTADLSYHIEFAGRQTRNYQVSVFEFPRLERADAQLTFPKYTGLAEKKIENTRRVSAVEGSLLDLSLQLNKAVASAKLIAKDKTVLPLVAETNKANASLGQLKLEASQTYELQLVDTAGRTNKVPAQFVINVLKNRQPELKIVSPRGDQRVSPLEEITFQGEAWDDFGLTRYGISYTVAGRETKSIELGESTTANEKRPFNYLLRLEDFSAQPDQLVSYFIWADDIGPDGEQRRTSSDMFFAEVRPFDEIFRQGQPQESESESQQSGSESLKLAELQKQIINATWKLQRGSSAKPLPSTYKADAEVIEKSQEEALKQAGSMKERRSDPHSKALVEAVEKEMDLALSHLSKAGKSPEALPAALSAEQAAYQALLRLSAREYQISQSRSRSASAGQRNQQQLDQLELKQSENRYETQRQAATKQNPEQREQLQILNRLKELAQRQQDLNERLKELQTALQEARTEDEREEIRRRLKRLREEEQQVLADVDELRQRMDRPENQSRMAEARQQLDNTRSQVQKAADAMDKEAVPQALTSATRAQRQLQELRDDWRKKSSAQFADEMREMRSEARQLAQNQEEIGQKLQSRLDSKQKKLSDDGPTKEILDQLQQQKQKMTNLLDQMTHVSQEAEAAEPLLSKQLYDTLRKTSQSNVDDSLDKARELLQRSFVSEAGQFEQRARKEINDVKQGVERAAESVLGDETEALRLARAELDDLKQQLEKEMAQANPKSGSGQNAAEQRENAEGQTQEKGQEKGLAQSSQEQGGQPSSQAAKGQSQDPTGNSAPGKDAKGQSAQNGQPNSREPQTGSGQRQGGSPSGSPQLADANSQGQPPDQASQQSGNAGQNPGEARSQQASNQSRQTGGTASGRGRRTAERGTATPGTAQNFFDQGNNTGGAEGGQRGPLTGDDYSDWSDRLRDIEEMVDIPEIRNEVARIRERARAMRTDIKRQSKAPQWDLVRTQIATPLAEVRQRVAEELARRESKDSLVPIDRDPVPTKFSELVRKYYEKLGGAE